MHIIKQFFIHALDFLMPKQEIEKITLENFLDSAEYLPQNTKATKEDWIVAVYKYRSPLVKSAITALKYKESIHAAKLLASGMHPLLLDQISEMALFENHESLRLIPIPLSKQRLRDRGYNQAEILASEILKIGDDKIIDLASDLLVRNRHTLPQTKTKSRKERLENIKGCFSVPNQKKVAGKNIILIDDVTTTGATLNEARLELLEADATSVVAITAAH